jgi:hypothetical protein
MVVPRQRHSVARHLRPSAQQHLWHLLTKSEHQPIQAKRPYILAATAVKRLLLQVAKLLRKRHGAVKPLRTDRPYLPSVHPHQHLQLQAFILQEWQCSSKILQAMALVGIIREGGVAGSFVLSTVSHVTVTYTYIPLLLVQDTLYNDHSVVVTFRIVVV